MWWPLGMHELMLGNLQFAARISTSTYPMGNICVCYDTRGKAVYISSICFARLAELPDWYSSCTIRARRRLHFIIYLLYRLNWRTFKRTNIMCTSKRWKIFHINVDTFCRLLLYLYNVKVVNKLNKWINIMLNKNKHFVINH